MEVRTFNSVSFRDRLNDQIAKYKEHCSNISGNAYINAKLEYLYQLKIRYLKDRIYDILNKRLYRSSK